MLMHNVRTTDYFTVSWASEEGTSNEDKQERTTKPMEREKRARARFCKRRRTVVQSTTTVSTTITTTAFECTYTIIKKFVVCIKKCEKRRVSLYMCVNVSTCSWKWSSSRGSSSGTSCECHFPCTYNYLKKEEKKQSYQASSA